MDYEQLGNQILNLDKTIRFVEIYHKGRKYSKLRKDVKSFLTLEETEQSINDAILRWKTRVNLSSKLGEPVYAMAEYKKLKRVTIPFTKDGLILVSLEPDGFHEIIIKEIIEIVHQYSS